MKPPFSAEKVYQHCLPQLQKSLFNKSLAIELQEDLLQEVYLKLMHVEHWSEIDNIAGYVQTILNNLLIDHFRKQKDAVDDFDLLSLQDPKCLETQLSSQQSLKQIEQLIAQQKPEHQDLLWRAKVVGHSHQQIANDKGRSLSWVEKSLARILAKCKKLVAEGEQQ